MTPPLQPPPTPVWRRSVWWGLGLVGVLLFPAVQLYHADHGVLPTKSEAPPTSSASAHEAVVTKSAPAAAVPVEAWQERATRTGVDASVYYKNAFVFYAALTDEEKKMFRQPIDELDEEKAAALFQKIQPIMELLRQGAEADYCEWALGEPSFDMKLPHISKSLELGRLVHWSANYRFPSDSQGALADLQMQARLGDHLADTVIGWLVQMSMESGANKVLRQHAGTLDDAATLQAQGFLQSSTVGKNAARAFATEVAGVEAMMKKLIGQSPAERVKVLQMMEAPGEKVLQPAIQRMLQDEAALTAEFQYLRQVEQQMAEAMPWPEAQYQAWWKGVESGLPEHPLAAMSLPALTGLRTRMQQTQVERAMLSAGLTLLQSGPEQLGRFRDPVTSAAFTYLPKPDGFELQSTFKNKGKPVTMSFTRPK